MKNSERMLEIVIMVTIPKDANPARMVKLVREALVMASEGPWDGMDSRHLSKMSKNTSIAER